MDRNDGLFDKKIREKLKIENSFVPDNINKIFDESIKKGKKKSSILKKVSGLCAASLVGLIIFGITMPTYASNIPIIGSIFENFKLNRYENYDKYSSDLNIAKESEGMNFTIDKVVYDGFDLDIFYTIESEKIMKKSPDITTYKVEVDGKMTSFGSGRRGELSEDGKMYIGNISYAVNSNSLVPDEFKKTSNYGLDLEIPDDFTLRIKLNGVIDFGEMYVTRPTWEFEIPVSNEMVEGQVEEYDINIDLGDIHEGTTINRIITTPINTIVQWITDHENGIYPQDVEAHLSFEIFDDKGRYIQSKSGDGGSYGNNKMYHNDKFKEIYEDTKSLTFILYGIRFEENMSEEDQKRINNNLSVQSESVFIEPEKLSVPLNLSGETKLNTKDGDTYATITKVDVVEGKTKIHFKSKYALHAVPTEIVNKNTGEIILPSDNLDMMEPKTTKYIHETGEFVIEFNKEISDGEYRISYYDQSKTIIPYEDSIFTVDVSR